MNASMIPHLWKYFDDSVKPQVPNITLTTAAKQRLEVIMHNEGAWAFMHFTHFFIHLMKLIQVHPSFPPLFHMKVLGYPGDSLYVITAETMALVDFHYAFAWKQSGLSFFTPPSSTPAQPATSA